MIKLRIRRAVLLAPLLLVLVLASLPISPARADQPATQEVYFDSTGQTLGGAFLDGWTQLGGRAVDGDPVSPPVQEGDHWVQWFEYSKLEIDKPTLDSAAAADVHVAAIGLSIAQRLGLTTR